MPVSELFSGWPAWAVFVVLALGAYARGSVTYWLGRGARVGSERSRWRRYAEAPIVGSAERWVGRVGAPWCRSVSPSASRARSTSRPGCSACRNAASNRPSSSVPCSGPRSTRRSARRRGCLARSCAVVVGAARYGRGRAPHRRVPPDHPSRRGVILPDRHRWRRGQARLRRNVTRIICPYAGRGRPHAERPLTIVRGTPACRVTAPVDPTRPARGIPVAGSHHRCKGKLP